MINTQVQTTNLLPAHLARIEQLKSRSLSVSQRLRGKNDELAQRMENCADWLKVRRYNNGFTSLHSAWYCRVRGCPIICEEIANRVRQGQIASGLRIAAKSLPKHEFLMVTLPMNPVEVSEIRAAMTQAHQAVTRLSKRKEFCFPGYATLTQTACFMGQTTVEVHLLLLAPPSFFSRRYISRSSWRQLWQSCLRVEDTPPVQQMKLGHDDKAILRQTWDLSKVDLSLIDDELLEGFVESIHRQNTFSVSGLFREWMRQRPKEKKTYHPSEIANFEAATSTYYGHLPNPEDKQHRNQ